MAPEIHEGKPYKGEEVDLFASAIILFIMVSGGPPFEKAEKGEKYYRMIYNRQWDLFWRFHSRSKPGGTSFYSESFKNLIEGMLAYDIDKRLTIPEILEHPWMKDVHATYEEVLEECKARHEVNEEKKAEEKKRSKKHYGSDRHRGFHDEDE